MRLTLPDYLADLSKWAEYFKILIWQVNLDKNQSEIPEQRERDFITYTFICMPYMNMIYMNMDFTIIIIIYGE